MLAGQVIVGFCVSLTVTVNEQFAGLPDPSVTVQLTVVVPVGKLEPEGGLQTGVPTFGQLSVAVAFAYVTTAEHWLAAVPCTTFAGQVITGACVSLTVTVNEQVAVSPAPSVTVQFTVVVPFGNEPPDGGVQTTAFGGSGQLSEPVGVA